MVLVDGQREAAGVLPHRFGYRLPSCSPAELDSDSPGDSRSMTQQTRARLFFDHLQIGK